MAAAHSYSLLKAFFRYLCLLFCTAHIFLDISSTLAAEFSLESTPRDSPERPLNHSILPSLHHSVDTPPHTPPQILPSITVIKIQKMYVGIINIGTLKFQVYALLSTGHSFNWFLCDPCDPCFEHQNGSIFIPVDSESYGKVSCINNIYCTWLQKHACDAQYKCKFENKYGFGTIVGIASSDELRFDKDRENPLLNKFIFGCVNNASGHFPKLYITGIIGLNRGVHSVVRQLGVDIFSVCLPDDESTGYVKFGSAANSPGLVVTTKLVLSESNLYYIQIVGLTVGKQLRIIIGEQRNTFFLVDTGTPMSRVDGETMRKLIESFKSAVPFKSMVHPEPGYELCYHVEGDPPNIHVFPYMRVEFLDGGYIFLHASNLFLPVQNNNWCLSIKSTDRKFIFGGDAMAKRDIVFDLHKNLISYSAHGKC